MTVYRQPRGAAIVIRYKIIKGENDGDFHTIVLGYKDAWCVMSGSYTCQIVGGRCDDN